MFSHKWGKAALDNIINELQFGMIKKKDQMVCCVVSSTSTVNTPHV